MKKDTLLDIDQVTQLTSLSQATLRNWEKRYDFPRPQRSQGGHRLYDMEEVRKIRDVNGLCKKGMKVKEAIEKVVNSGTDDSSLSTSLELPFETLNDSLTLILESLYRYDGFAAQEYLSRLGMRLSETDLLEIIYPRLLQQVGEDWESQRINIAQEHFSWGFLRKNLLSFSKMIPSSKFQPKAILTTLSGELHEGALIILGAYLSLKGWNITYLGVDLPAEDLGHACEAIKPDMICLSGIHGKSIIESWSYLKTLNTPVVVGGPCLKTILPKINPGDSWIRAISGSLSSCHEQLELLFYASRGSHEASA